MTKDQPWHKYAENLSEDIYQQIIKLPFVQSLADGTLPMDRFQFYLSQDSLYLNTYCRSLAHTASRLPESDMTAIFLKFATDGIAVEKALHQSYLKDNIPSADDISPACQLYTSWLLSHATGPVEIEAAALLPCFTIYGRVGEHIAKMSAPDNPYNEWIATYSDSSFAESCRLACEVCDRLAQKASPETFQQMARAFVTASKMEWLFWDSAWNKRIWPV